MDLSEKIKTAPISQLIRELSAPAILSLLLNALNTAIDGIFVAKSVGTAALSAVTISFGIVLIIQALSLLIAAGSSASISLRLGKNDRAGAEKVIGSAFLLSLLFAAAITATGLFTVIPLLRLYGATEKNLAYAREYISVILSGSCFFIMAQSMNNCVKGMGYAKRAFLNSLLSVITNTVLDAVFIFVFKWGVFGAALSTVIGNGACMIMAIRFLRSANCPANLRSGSIRPDGAGSILSIGLPASIVQFALSLVSLTFNHTAAFYGGTLGVASYGIMYNTMMTVYMPVIGLGQGIQPILGFNYSAGNYPRVEKALKLSVTYATVFACGMFLLIELASGAIVGAFGGTGDPSLTAMAVPGLRLFSLTLPFAGFQMVSANYFQYIGKIKQSVILSSLRQLILLIPFALLFPAFTGITGIWLATPAADLISFAVTVVFIKNELGLLKKQ